MSVLGGVGPTSFQADDRIHETAVAHDENALIVVVIETMVHLLGMGHPVPIVVDKDIAVIVQREAVQSRGSVPEWAGEAHPPQKIVGEPERPCHHLHRLLGLQHPLRGVDSETIPTLAEHVLKDPRGTAETGEICRISSRCRALPSDPEQ